MCHGVDGVPGRADSRLRVRTPRPADSRVAYGPGPEPVRLTTARTHVVRPALSSYLMRAAMVNWLASALAILYALFITPVVIRALNTDLYGVWSFLNGLLAYS